jgi:hypothetical protein
LNLELPQGFERSDPHAERSAAVERLERLKLLEPAALVAYCLFSSFILSAFILSNSPSTPPWHDGVERRRIRPNSLRFILAQFSSLRFISN